MHCKRGFSAGRFCLSLLAALMVAGCASRAPAPVVNRTDLPLPGMDPSGGTLPGQPQAGQPGAEVSPMGGIPGPGASDPNLKTGPKGLKRPYGEMAAVSPGATAGTPGATSGAIGGTGVPAGASSGVGASNAPLQPSVAAIAPPSVLTPAVPPKPTIPLPAGGAGGAGLLDGVAFGWPAAGTVVQNFDQTSSKGLALGGKPGDVVRSAADGRVIFSGAGPRGYGNLVIVKHDNELLSVYAHNRSLAVKEGESVRRGQKIAELGNSGTDTPKLHFEIRQQGKPIDPLAVLPKR